MRAWTRFLFVAAVLAAAVSLLPAGHAEEGQPFALEARIPASSLGMISLESVGTWGARWEKTAIAKMIADPDMQGFVDPIAEDIEKLMSGEGGRGPLEDVPPVVMDLLEQLKGLEGQVGFAVLGMQEGQRVPTMAASLDFGPHVNDFTTFLKRVKAELGEDGDAIVTTEKDGRTWWQIDADEMLVSATTVDTTFVLATDPATLQQIIGAGREGSLAATSDFQAVRKKAGGDDLGAFVYANVPAIMEIVGEEMPRDARKIAKALGLDTVKAAAYGMAFKGDGFMDSFVIHTPGADHGLAAMDLLPPMRPQALQYVPSTAFYYEESAVALGELMPRVRKLVGDVEPDAVEEMNEALSDISQTIGVDIENELMAGMGNGVAVYAGLPETGGIYPELAVMMKVKDPAAFEPIFDRFANGLAGWLTEEGDVIASTREIQYRGQTLHLFEMQEARGDDVVPFTPTWAFRGNWLTLTLVPYSMKEIILRTSEGTADGGLAGEEDFQALMAQMPADAGAIGYLDFQAIMNLLYDTGVPLLQTVAKPNVMQLPIRLDWAQLPPARSMRKYFRSIAGFTSWTKDGMSVSIHAPVPVVALVGAVAGAAFFTLGRSMDMEMSEPMVVVRPDRVDFDVAQVQAEEILRYVRLYRLEKSTLPKSIEALVEANYMRAVPKDPWGNPYYLMFKMRMVDGKSRQDAAVASAGPDGKPGTPDDVTATVK
ncbi:MAG: DUF3352 domain-containing protein [Planctomycetota bacterium]|nr:DUF3352 domain-containing protein [Planctomycetota bacterium]